MCAKQNTGVPSICRNIYKSLNAVPLPYLNKFENKAKKFTLKEV